MLTHLSLFSGIGGMTIERLEEIKNILYEALHYQENCRDFSAEEQMEKDVNKLIDAEIERVRDAIKDFANKFHRMDECGRIELKAESKPEVKDYWQGLLSEGEEYDV